MAMDKTISLWDAAQPEPVKETRWPGWDTVKLIGRGTYGAVYEIQRDVFGSVEKAALKVISIPRNERDLEEMYCEGYDNESITETFREHMQSIVGEYSLMRKMSNCHHIVRSEDIRYIQHDNSIGWDIFIKMELLTPLMKVLPERIPEQMVYKLAIDICKALVTCKEYGVIHRDIKPQNIFVSQNGEYKLGDFGIAKTVEKTMGGTLAGTFKFMAPEVFFYKPYGHGADLYSLGLVLYWMLNTCRHPFMPQPPTKISTTMEEKARMRRFQGEQLPLPVHGSENLKRIVMKACAYDPKDRYASAADMLRDLQEGFTDLKSLCKQEEEQRKAEKLRRKEEEHRKDALAEVERRSQEEQERRFRELEEQDKTVMLFDEVWSNTSGIAVKDRKKENQSQKQEEIKVCEICGTRFLPGRTFCVQCGGIKQEKKAPEVKQQPVETKKKEDESWRKSEAMHRAWLKQQAEQEARQRPVTEKLSHAEKVYPKGNSQQEKREKQAWEQEEQERLMRLNRERQQKAREKQAAEELQRAEEAHRYWMKQQQVKTPIKPEPPEPIRYCQVCGAQILPNRWFCVKCGNYVDKVSAPNQSARTQKQIEQEIEARFQNLQNRRRNKKT